MAAASLPAACAAPELAAATSFVTDAALVAYALVRQKSIWLIAG
jgi:hypothetical protein